MNAEYDVELYKRIARLKLDETVITNNRNGNKETIYIRNIVELTWHQLQLLIYGVNKFNKMINLYNMYSHNPIREDEITLIKDTNQEKIDVILKQISENKKEFMLPLKIVSAPNRAKMKIKKKRPA